MKTDSVSNTVKCMPNLCLQIKFSPALLLGTGFKPARPFFWHRMESTGELNNRFNLPHASRAWARAGNSIEIPLSFQPPPPPVGQLVPDITALLFFTCVHKETAHQFNCSQNGMVLIFFKNGDNTEALQSKSEVQNGTNQTVYKSRCTGKRTSTSPGCPESWVKSWTTMRASFNPARKLGNQPEGRGHRKTGASHRRHRRKEDEVTDLSGKASVDQNGWYGLEKQPSFKQPVSLSTAVSLCLSIKAQPLSTWTLLHETGWKNMQWRLFSFTI